MKLRMKLRQKLAVLVESPARNLIFGLFYMVVVVALATIAYAADGWSWGDAFYFVVITVFTVGYDEIHPIISFDLRFITIATVIFGCTGIIFLTGALVQFITFAQIQLLLGTKRMKTHIEQMQNHVIICGFGRIGQMLSDELKAGGIEFVVLEQNEQRYGESVALKNPTIRGDATDETVLEAAGIARARALACVVPNDAANVFITLSARNLNKNLEIIARGEAPSTKSKLLQAGANSVVEPAHIGAERIGQLIMYPRSSSLTDGSERMRMLNSGLQTLGLGLEVMAVAAESPLAGASIETIEHQASGSVFVVAVNRRNGETLTRPDAATIVEAGDGVVLITRTGRSGPKVS